MTKYSQKATYWESSGLDIYGGATFEAPVIIDVRWEDKQENYINRANNEEAEQNISHAILYTQADIVFGGYLFLGETTETNPRSLEDAFFVNRVEVSYNVSGSKYIRKVFL
jgi:hypothetical protein